MISFRERSPILIMIKIADLRRSSGRLGARTSSRSFSAYTERKQKQPSAGRLAQEFSYGFGKLLPLLGELRSIRMGFRRVLEPLVELK